MTAALYLREFTGSCGTAGLHIDMSAPSWADGDDGELIRGATGWGVRGLLRWLETMGLRPPPRPDAARLPWPDAARLPWPEAARPGLWPAWRVGRRCRPAGRCGVGRRSCAGEVSRSALDRGQQAVADREQRGNPLLGLPDRLDRLPHGHRLRVPGGRVADPAAGEAAVEGEHAAGAQQPQGGVDARGGPVASPSTKIRS